MPKRIPTPPPPDDEPRYLTVVHPYPLNANMMIHADRRTLALWLACCTGSEVLLAMYYKPASPGMVIIEVDRDFDRFDELLGLHSWSKFLSRPTEEENDKESKVFWCHYNSGRLVQKNGWKRVDIEEHWFKGWSPNNTKIKFPYPKTVWCDVPSEAKTGVPLCRPLPKAQFPAPPPKPPPVVGSAEWNHAKSSDTSSSVATPSSKRRGDRSIAPSDSVSMISGVSSSSGGTQSARPSTASTVSTAWRMAEYRARQEASSRGPRSIASVTSPPGSRAPSTISGGNGSRSHSSRGSVGPPARPPGLNLQYNRFDWGDEVDRFEAEREDELTTPPASRASFNSGLRGSNAPRRYIPDPEGPIDPDQDYEYEEDDKPRRSIADAMKAVFDGDSDEEVTLARDWDDTQELVDNRDPWNGYDAPRWEKPVKIPRKGGEEWECPDHGSLCSPGICKVRARVELERRWEKEREDREEKKREKKEKQERKRIKQEMKLAREEGREFSFHDLPPHFSNVNWGRDSDSSGNSSDGNSARGERGNQGSHTDTESCARPPAGLDGEDMYATRPPWDDDDDDDVDKPKITVNMGPSAPSVTTSDYDERGRCPPPLLGDDARSVKSSSTVSTNIKGSKSNVSRGTAASRQPPGNPRSAATVRSATSSAWGEAPAGSQSPAPGQRNSTSDARSAASSHPPAPSVSKQTSGDDDVADTQSSGQRKSVRDTRSVASSRAPALSTRNEQASQSDDDTDTRSIPSGQRQPAGKLCSPSVGIAPSSVGSERRTGSYADSISRTSSSTSQRGPERDSHGSTTLYNTARSFTSTSARTAVSSDSAPPEGGFPTFHDTEWGDTITAAQYRLSTRRGKKESDGDVGSDEASASETDMKTNRSGQNATGSGKKYKGWTKGRGSKNKFAAKRGGTPKQPQSDALSVAMGIDLPAGGPGSKWGDANDEW